MKTYFIGYSNTSLLLLMSFSVSNPFYKYLDTNGLKATLENGSLLFSKPSVFNDPFDMLINNLFNYDPIATTDEYLKAFCRFMKQEKFPDIKDLGEMGIILKMVFENLKNSKMDKDLFEKELLASSGDLFDLSKLQETSDQCLEITRKVFSRTGVCCGSNRADNLLLWAHYAEKHRGGVIKFRPNIEKDSMLLVAQRVQYLENRPFLYESHDDFLKKSLLTQEAKAASLSSLVTLSKGIDWKYEEELRICIPNLMNQKDRELLRYHDDEVEEVYIGCKASPEDEAEIIKLAKARNPKVKTFKMKSSSKSYGLTPVEG